MNRLRWLAPLGMLISALITAWLVGQEPAPVDPFGDTKEAPKAAPPAEDKKKKSTEKLETDSIVLGIRDSNPKSPSEVMQAVINLANYGRADAARRYMSALIQSKFDDMTFWQLQRKFGSASCFRLSSQPDLQPEGRQLSDLILDGANRFVRDPARLDTLIKQLSHADVEMRHAAIVDLREAGGDAAVGIIKALGDSTRAAERPVLQSALVRLSHASVGPLLGALDTPHDALRSQLIVALGQLQVSEAAPFLLRTYFTSAAGSADQRAAAESLLKSLGELPSRPAAERMLLRMATAHFNGQLPGKPDHENRIEMWSWDEKSQQPVRERLDAQAAAQRLAARLAGELVALAPGNQEYRRLRLTAVLESAKLAAGWEKPLATGAGTPFALAVDHRDAWDDVLGFALQGGHTAAAVGMLEVIAAAGDASLVQSSGGQIRETVKALHHPQRRVQFAAVQAIRRLAPRQPFAGASFLPEMLGYFASTAGSPRVLVGHPRAEASQNLAGSFRELGVDSELATSGPQAFQLAQRSSDLEFVVLSDGFDKPSIQEQVRQFRREPRTAKLPIGILARPETFDRLRLAFNNDSRTEVFGYPTDLQGATFVMRRLWERVDRDAVPHEERMNQAAEALDFMATLAENPQAYGFYELLPQQSAVEQALSVPALCVKAARVLGLLGSPQAQRTLVSQANQSGRQLVERQAAARAFQVAVQRRGLLLNRDEILRQYQTYNGSATADMGTQQVLASILDTIEAPTSDASKIEAPKTEAPVIPTSPPTNTTSP